MTAGLSRHERKAETREALLRAAARRFASGGIESTSLERIAADLGLTKGAVYAHFASKSDLVAAVLDAFESEPALTEMRSHYVDETRSFEERMREVGRIGAALADEGILGLSGLEAVLLDLESALYALRNRDPDVVASNRHLFDSWGALIDEAQAARGEPLAMSGATLRLLLYNLFRGFLIAHAQSHDLVTPRVFEDAFTDLAIALATGERSRDGTQTTS